MGSSPFLNEIRTSIELRGMSLRTEKTYIYWIRDFIRFHNRKHPNIMDAAEILSSFEVASLLREMSAGCDKLIFSLLFGSGLRITECLRLRIKDFDFINGTVSRHGCLFFHQADYAIIQSLVHSVATICMTLFHEKYSSKQSLIVVCCTNVLLVTHLGTVLRQSY